MNQAAIEKLRKVRLESSLNVSKDEAMAQILQNSSIVRKNPYYRGVKEVEHPSPPKPFLSEKRLTKYKRGSP